MDSSELTQLSEEIIQRLGNGVDLDGMMSNGMFPSADVYMDETNDGENEPDDVIILHMDIREPLRTLQKLIEHKIGVNLKGYSFWLQDAQELQPHKNLVDQCVKGEGLVQINVQIQTIAQRINIMDVLKPTEAALAALGVEEACMEAETTDDDHEVPYESQESDVEQDKIYSHDKTDESSQEKPCLNWVLDSKFKKEQSRLKIPEDPVEWNVAQVKHWFQWAVRQFNLTNINVSDWAISGNELCALTHEEFRQKMSKDPGNVFWTHLQLLKECKFVSVVHKAAEKNTEKVQAIKIDNYNDENISAPRELKIMRTKVQAQHDGAPAHGGSANAYGVGSGNNGQVQLWQFLLELLTDREHTSIIQWVGNEGEFKLTDPERVARLWGEKKNKPAMNYEKLSRALRYYYDGDMISKVSGKRFAYKFDCDLKLLIGYNAEELSALVNEKSVSSIATEADFATTKLCDKDDQEHSEEE